MRFSVVAPVALGEKVAEGALVHSSPDRGIGLGSEVDAAVAGTDVKLTGLDLRTLALAVWNRSPAMADYGRGRWGTTLASSSGHLAHLDAGRTDWSYRLYSREAGATPRLTRWQRAGRINTRRLVELGGGGSSLGRSALVQAFGDLVGAGLPEQLPLSTPDEQQVDAPEPGIFDVDKGTLTTSGESVLVYAVHDLGAWPGSWSYEQSGQ